MRIAKPALGDEKPADREEDAHAERPRREPWVDARIRKTEQIALVTVKHHECRQQSQKVEVICVLLLRQLAALGHQIPGFPFFCAVYLTKADADASPRPEKRVSRLNGRPMRLILTAW
jgi:hypothetical protein